MSKLRDRRHRHDAFFQRAHDAGFAARSVYKLAEIDRRFGLLAPGARVLDLGCRPGSWLQYARERVGPRGAVVGIDLRPLEPPPPGVRVLVGDVLEIAESELTGDLGAFDVVLSDMAPDTTGIRAVDQARSAALVERALEIAERTLAPRGAFVAKVFQGPDVAALVARARAGFAAARMVKPEASRKESLEQYLVATGRKRPAP